LSPDEKLQKEKPRRRHTWLPASNSYVPYSNPVLQLQLPYHNPSSFFFS